MNVLVTGGAGFIGSNFVQYLLRPRGSQGLRVINLDKLTYAGNMESLGPVLGRRNHVFIKGDITDRKLVRSVFRKYRVDQVVNFAAESHVDRSILEPDLFLRTNVLGTEVLLSTAREAWCVKGKWRRNTAFIQVSTDEVYGSLGRTGLFTEQTPLAPRSPYSASKASADLMVQAYGETFGMRVNVTRCSNNYGPYQFPEKLIPFMLYNALRHRKLPVYGDGKNVRDWLYVEDHCRAVDRVRMKGRPGRIYNIGGSNEKRNLAVLEVLLALLREYTGDARISGDLITFIKDRPGHDRRYAIDSSRIKRELGWKPRTGFNAGLRRTVRWYLDNRDWLDHAASGEYRKFYNKNYRNR